MRLDIQIVPWALPRSVVGIQSAVIREIDGNVPAWNAPNRNRKSTRNETSKPDVPRQEDDESQARGERRAAQDDRRQDVPDAEPVAEKPPGDLEEAIADHERGHHVAEMLVGQAERVFEFGRRGRETDAVDVGDDRQATGRGQYLVADPTGRPSQACQQSVVRDLDRDGVETHAVGFDRRSR